MYNVVKLTAFCIEKCFYADICNIPLKEHALKHGYSTIFFSNLNFWIITANFGFIFKLSVTRNTYARQVFYDIILPFLL